ncbi:MAG: hypothetical protein AB2A00_24915 [Myxococcota bacterium]
MFSWGNLATGERSGTGYSDGVRKWDCPDTASPESCPVEALFYGPSGIAATVDAVAPNAFPPGGSGQGAVYISESSANIIRKIDLVTGEVTTVAGRYREEGFADGVGANALFRYPTALVLAPGGTSLYVADSGNACIRHIDLTTGEVSTFAGAPGQVGYVDGSAVDARIHTPSGMAYHLPRNELWVTDSYYSTVRAVSVTTQSMTTVAGASDGYADGFGTAALFWAPEDIAISMGGLAFVADRRNTLIRWVDGTGPAGQPCYVGTVDGTRNSVNSLVQAGGLGFDDGQDDGTGTGNRIGEYAIIGNTTRQLLHFIPAQAAPNPINFLSGQGSPGFRDGTGDSAFFSFPSSIASRAGTHYVADTGNDAIRMVEYGGLTRTLAGSAKYRKKYSLTPDGGATPEHTRPEPFDEPRGMTLGMDCNPGPCQPNGQILVVDARQHSLFRIVENDCGDGPQLDVDNIAGSPYETGAAPERRFNGPLDVAVNYQGYIFVSEQGGNTIQRVTPPVDGCDPVAPEQVTWAGVTYVRSMAISADGRDLFVTADRGVYRVSTVDDDNNGIPDNGSVDLVAGGNYEFYDGVGSGAAFRNPQGITRDLSNPNVYYVADGNNYAIRKVEVDPGTGVGTVTTVAGSYYESFWRDGPAAIARFGTVYDVAVDNAGNVYVAEGARIRKIGTDGMVSTIIGGGSNGVLSGTGPDGMLDGAAGILWEPGTGNLYIAEMGNKRIRVAKPALPDRPTINYIRVPVNTPVQLSTAPQNATSFTWDFKRRPTASSAPLLTTAGTQTFTPDRADLYIFRVTMSGNIPGGGPGVTRATVTLDVCDAPRQTDPVCPACGIDEVCAQLTYCCRTGDQWCNLGVCMNCVGAGGTCNRDRQCCSGNCDETIGQCVGDQPDAGGGGPFAQCGDDSGCPLDKYCRNGWCVPREGCGVFCDRNRVCAIDSCVDGLCACCDDDTDCPSGTCDEATGTCLNPDGGIPVVTDGGPLLDAGADAGTVVDAGNGMDAGNQTDAGLMSCIVDSDCPLDRYCQTGVCVPREQCAAFCDRDRMCLSDSCVGNSCFCCTNDTQCPSLDCDETTGRCTPPDGGGPDCITDSNCPSDRYCDNGVCVPQQGCGNSCDRARMCISNSCTGNVCSNCVTCINDAMCPTGNYCCQLGDPNCQAGACVLACTDNAQCCDRDTMCLSGICDEGTRTCIPQADAGPQMQCTVDSDCPLDMYCQGGVCVATERCGVLCDRNRMCVSDSCVGGVCSNCVSCTQDSQCPARNYCCLNGENGCTVGSCTPDCTDNNVCCDRDSMCTSGICEETTRTCQPQADAGTPAQCNVDPDCPSDMYCLDGACVPREACDVLCDRNRMCISDACEGGLCVAGVNGCNPGSSGDAGADCDAGMDAGAGLDAGDNARRRDGGPAKRGNIAQEAGQVLARACGCSTTEGGASPEMLVSAGAMVVLALVRGRRRRS